MFLNDLAELLTPDYSKRKEDLVVSVQDIEVIRNRYSNTNFDIISDANESSIKIIAIYIANKGLCSVKFINDNDL